MEKYKFRSTVYLVFLLVSLFVNGLVLYMLMSGYSVKTHENYEINEISIMEDVNRVYKDAYNLINSDDFYVVIDTPLIDPVDVCYSVDIAALKYYFTEDFIEYLSSNLENIDGNMCDCSGEIQNIFFSSLFGLTDQGIRELNYVMSNDDVVLVKGKLKSNEFIMGDLKYLYMVLKYEKGKLLIDSFE